MQEKVHIGKKINILSKRIRRRVDKEAALYGLTGVQVRIIIFISKKSGKRDIFQRDIEEELDIRRSSVTSVLQLMESNGYITRESVAEDARLKKLILTQKGMEIYKKVFGFIIKFEESLCEELTDEEFTIFINLIDRISNKIAD